MLAEADSKVQRNTRFMLKILADWLTGTKPPARESQVAFRVLLGDLEVGTLSREDNEWTFRYSEAFRSQTKVQPIIDFPNLEAVYRNPTLWPFFQLRIPSTSQPEVVRRIMSTSLGSFDEGVLLREFGRWSVANPFELQPA